MSGSIADTVRSSLFPSGRIPIYLALLALLAFTPLVLFEGTAEAATITVTTTDDELNADGDCSLREAIQAANTDAAVDACAAGSGADTVFVPGGTYLLTGASGEDANATGDLDLSSDITLSGAGAGSTVVDGGGVDRVVHVVAPVQVEIVALSLTGGAAPDHGGAVRVDLGTVTLREIVVSGNSAGTTAGGVFNVANTTIVDSTVDGNTVGQDAGGVYNLGGTMTR